MKYFFFLTFFILNIIAGESHAQERHATLEIFASQKEASAGNTFYIAIRQNIDDEWHTYWQNAGDSGEPMSIEWITQDGVTISDLRFPTPKEIRYDPLVNYGFEGRPIYLQTVTVDEDFKDDAITLQGDAFWLICKEICIPEMQTISLTIPVGANRETTNSSIFVQAKNNMPQEKDWPARLEKKGNTAFLTVSVPEDVRNNFQTVEVYPYDWGVMKTAETAVTDIRDNGEVVISKTAEDRDFAELVEPQFVLKTEAGAYVVKAGTGGAADVVAASSVPFLVIIIFAFIGGIILNLMPCVFPILSMKALSLVKLSGQERRHAQASGIGYTVGIVASFVAIALLLIGLKAAGASIGWGFQLQNPYVVAILATLLFVIALNLAGLFEISSRFVNLGARFTRGNDVKSSFFTGVLACMVATPCSAPFMASAIGYALTQTMIIAIIVFIILGLGLAFPYLILCFIPKVQKILPKPGPWMQSFRQFLAFPMMASAIWLVWVLSRQAGDMAVLYILALFLTITFIIWLYRRSVKRSVKSIIAAVMIAILIVYAPLLSKGDAPAHEAFTQARLQTALEENPDRPVFVNMTASWCITCLVNERTTLSQASVTQTFEDYNVLYMKGDWTNKNQEITQYLESFQRNGVPLYVFYNKADENGRRPEPQILPQILTPAQVIGIVKGETP